MTDTGALTAEAARLLGDYIKGGRQDTSLLKATAAAIVDLRAAHHLEDGRVDWSGRSPEYRKAIAEVYSKAHVPAEKMDTVQQALRYHVGNLLRQRADADDLAAVGLTALAPKQRLARQREVVAALATTGSVAEVLNDPVRLAAHAEVLLDYITEKGLVDLRGKDRVAARMALEGIARRSEALLPFVARQGGGGGGAVEAV